MSDVAAETAEKKPVEPAEAKGANEGDGYGAAFKSLQAEKARLEGELASLTKKLGDRDKELGEFKARVDGYVKRDREGAIVTKIKAARPDLHDIDIRGRLAIFAEDGKVDRFAEDADTASKAAIDLINQITPPAQNKRQPAMGGGPEGAPRQPQKLSGLDAAFGIR